MVDGTQDVVTVTKYNTVQKGTITVHKEGEVFSHVVEAGGLYQPQYEVQGQPGAVYDITALEDIVTPDGAVHLKAGELAATLTTGPDGTATSEPLYLGPYQVLERTAPDGLVKDPEPRNVVLSYAGQEVKITRDREEILEADKVVLPGVGSFGDAMGKLHQYGLVEVIRQVAEKKTPFLGICLGLQLLFERSDESPGVEGLGILKGEILRIPEGEGRKIPHMGWNSLELRNQGRLFAGLSGEPYVYFVHSYYLKARDEQIVKATTEYGVTIHASVEQDNIFACQFHPEKSSDTG